METWSKVVVETCKMCGTRHDVVCVKHIPRDGNKPVWTCYCKTCIKHEALSQWLSKLIDCWE